MTVPLEAISYNNTLERGNQCGETETYDMFHAVYVTAMQTTVNCIITLSYLVLQIKPFPWIVIRPVILA